MRSFSKPAVDVPAQLELLKRRGLRIRNEARAESFLQSVSFFRLSPYMRPFQEQEDVDHRFRDGSQFRQLTRLYEFDRQLRLLTMDAIERVEIASRAVISNHMGPTHGCHWYINPQMFHPTFDHQRLLTTLSIKQSNATRDYQRECERIDRLHADDKRKAILKRHRAKESYARHYPTTYAHPPLMPGIFAALCILNHLVHQVSPHARWDQRLYQLIHEFPDVSLKAMGFPPDWYQDPFWHTPRT